MISSQVDGKESLLTRQIKNSSGISPVSISTLGDSKTITSQQNSVTASQRLDKKIQLEKRSSKIKQGLNGTGALNFFKIPNKLNNDQCQLNVTSSTIGGDTAAATLAPTQANSSVTLNDDLRVSSLVNLAKKNVNLITMQSL